MFFASVMFAPADSRRLPPPAWWRALASAGHHRRAACSRSIPSNRPGRTPPGSGTWWNPGAPSAKVVKHGKIHLENGSLGWVLPSWNGSMYIYYYCYYYWLYIYIYIYIMYNSIELHNQYNIKYAPWLGPQLMNCQMNISNATEWFPWAFACWGEGIRWLNHHGSPQL